MTIIDKDAAARLARDYLTRQIELVPCDRPEGAYYVAHDVSEYVFFLVKDRDWGHYAGGGRYISVHLPTGSVTEFTSGE